MYFQIMYNFQAIFIRYKSKSMSQDKQIDSKSQGIDGVKVLQVPSNNTNHQRQSSSEDEQENRQQNKQSSNLMDDSVDRELARLQQANNEEQKPVPSRGNNARGNRKQPVREEEVEKDDQIKTLKVDQSQSEDQTETEKQAEPTQLAKNQTHGRNGRVKPKQEQIKASQKSDQSDWDKYDQDAPKGKKQRKVEKSPKSDQQDKQLAADLPAKQQDDQDWDKLIQDKSVLDRNTSKQNPIQSRDKEQGQTRGGRRGNRGDQNQAERRGNNRQGQENQNQGYQRREYRPRGGGDYTRHNNLRQGQNQSEGYNNRGRGGFRGDRGGFRGGRGGHDGYNRHQDGNAQQTDHNRNGRDYNRNDQNRAVQGNSSHVPVYNAVSIIQPQGNQSWPEVSLYIKKCKVSLTLRNLNEHEADSLVFPFQDQSFKLYPSALINASNKYRLKIREKNESNYWDNNYIYARVSEGLGKFKYVLFMRIHQQPDRVKRALIQLFRVTEPSSKIKSSSIVFPVCKELKDFKNILDSVITCLQALKDKDLDYIKRLQFTTKDPHHFKHCSEIFTNRIYQDIDANKIYIS